MSTIVVCMCCRRLRHSNILLLMAVCYTNDMDDLVLLYERVDSGSLHTHLYQKVRPLDQWCFVSLFCFVLFCFLFCVVTRSLTCMFCL